VPEVDCDPDQPPEAVQLVAFVEDHVRVEVPPLAILAELADNVTVGAGVLEPPEEPPEPEDPEEPEVSLAVEDEPLPPQPARARTAATMKPNLITISCRGLIGTAYVTLPSGACPGSKAARTG
jgi:hypothetical protein